VTPATVRAPARINEWSKPTFGERLDRISDPQTLFVGGLLFAGILILVWLVMQQVRRHVRATPLYSRSTPATEPRFTDGEPIASAPPKPESAAITEHEVPEVDRGYPFEESLPVGKKVIDEPPFIAAPLQPYEEPVGQGQPIPHQIPAFTVEPFMSEITQPTPEPAPARIEPEVAAEAAIMGRDSSQSSIESPSFAPKIISTESLAHQPTAPATMPLAPSAQQGAPVLRDRKRSVNR
ncbi:MAG: hypothetical protein ABJB32_06565, partial [Verrucomicrobiota bacterium]